MALITSNPVHIFSRIPCQITYSQVSITSGSQTNETVPPKSLVREAQIMTPCISFELEHDLETENPKS